MKPPLAHPTRRQFLFRVPAALGGATVLLPALALAQPPAPPQSKVDVRQMGAKGDGTTLDTAALQRAIEACATQHGGAVQFPPGRYLSGTLVLRSGVALHLEAGATLLGSPNLADYPSIRPALRSYTDNYTEHSLIYAENADHLTLSGRGVIDGQGAAFKGPFKVRPYLLRFVACRDVAVRELTLQDSPMWVQHYLACEGVVIDGLTVRSRCNGNNDGIDVDGCTRVRIAHCDIRSGDDAIVLKSTLARPCRDVVVTNCILSSNCNAFKLGTESNGGFENITLSNCTMYDTRLAGIALESVDGGVLERVTIQNVTMDRVRCPLFIRLGNRARPFQEGVRAPGLGTLRNVMISQVLATGADSTGCGIFGLPGHPVENVTLADLRLGCAGGGQPETARRRPPERPEAYPEYSMFGALPAYGLYCRHVRGLVLRDVSVEYSRPEARPALVCEEVEDLQLSGWSAQPPAGEAPLLRFEDVRGALVQGCRAPEKTGTYLSAGGKASAKLRLANNDLSEAARLLETDADLPANTVSVVEPK